ERANDGTTRARRNFSLGFHAPRGIEALPPREFAVHLTGPLPTAGELMASTRKPHKPARTKASPAATPGKARPARPAAKAARPAPAPAKGKAVKSAAKAAPAPKDKAAAKDKLAAATATKAAKAPARAEKAQKAAP